MRVLLVEDDPTTSRSIEMMLKHANLNVYSTDLGEEGVDLAKLYDYDIILLDLNLPDMTGHEVLRQLRNARVNTPILILSGLDDPENKLKGFGFGADDYLTKPFHREELVARIHAIIRRSQGHAQSVIDTGKVSVNLDAKTVEVEGRPVHLTGKEYQMLELLSLRKGTTLTKEMFLNHLYGGMDEPELKIIDVFICKLRKKLSEATGGDNYIETVWGRGYVLRDPVAEKPTWPRAPEKARSLPWQTHRDAGAGPAGWTCCAAPYHLSQGDAEGQGMTQRDSRPTPAGTSRSAGQSTSRRRPKHRPHRPRHRTTDPQSAADDAASGLSEPRPRCAAELAERWGRRIAPITRPMRRS
jgi:two-component system cell cycle response regulator CtrA